MKDLRVRLDKAIANKERQSKGKILKELKAHAKAAGFTLDQLIAGGGGGGAATRKSKGRKLAPKYRNPADATITWSGVGRRPKWIDAAIKAGNLDQLKI